MRRFGLAMCLIALGAVAGLGLPSATAAAPQPQKTDGTVEWGAPRAVVTCTAGVPSGVHFDFSYFAGELVAGPFDPVADVGLHPAGGAPAVQLGNDSIDVTPHQARGSFAHDFMITSAPGAGSTVELSVYLPTDASYLFIDQVVALTCPPPSSARPILPDIMDETVGSLGRDVEHDYLLVDASRSTQPWILYVYHDRGRQKFGPVRPGTKARILIGKQRGDGEISNVVLVGPVLVDIGEQDFFTIPHPLPVLIVLSATSIPQGGTALLSAEGFAPNSPVHVSLHSAPVALGTFMTNAHGKGTFVVKIPINTSLGEHQISAQGSFGENAEVGVDVVAATPSGPPSLAETGTHTAALTVLGFGLIVSGAGALALGRRRRAM